MPSIINATLSNGLVTSADNSGSLQLQTNNGTTAVTIDTSQNVGIGTTSTLGNSLLNVAQGVTARNSGSTAPYFQLYNANAGADLKTWRIGGGPQGQLVFDTVNDAYSVGTERMRINSAGELLVGTTSAWFDRKVIAEGGQGLAGIVGDITAYPLSCLSTPTSGNNLFVGFWTDSRGVPVFRGSIDYNRGAGQVRYNATSDATLKNIIGDSDGQKSVDILKSTRIREYAWKDDAKQKPQIGVIAQELYETYKGAVSVGGEDADGNYKPWGVDKTAFTFHLIAGWQAHEKLIQEQQAQIEELKAKVSALEGVK